MTIESHRKGHSFNSATLEATCSVRNSGLQSGHSGVDTSREIMF